MSYVKRTGAREFTVFSQKHAKPMGTYETLREARARQVQITYKATKTGE